MKQLQLENGKEFDSEPMLGSYGDMLHMDDHHEVDGIKASELKLRSRWMRYIRELKAIFTDRRYWKAQIKEWRALVSVPTGERLVDSQVLGWAYLEGGMIECAAALATFFAVFYFEWGVTATDAKRIQRERGFKPHKSPFLLQSGEFLVNI
jgi:sodium/potassium-transporting ATPase subunit alpha